MGQRYQVQGSVIGQTDTKATKNYAEIEALVILATYQMIADNDVSDLELKKLQDVNKNASKFDGNKKLSPQEIADLANYSISRNNNSNSDEELTKFLDGMADTFKTKASQKEALKFLVQISKVHEKINNDELDHLKERADYWDIAKELESLLKK